MQVGIGEKKCKKCGELKISSDFYINKHNSDGLVSTCKRCYLLGSRKNYYRNREKRNAKIKEYQSKNKDRLSVARKIWEVNNPEKRREISKRWAKKNPDKINENWLKQCYGLTLVEYKIMIDAQQGVCAICKRNPTEVNKLCVDHNHDTGELRGLLCSLCNTALGFFNDSKDILLEAIKYLEKYGK